MRKGFTPSSYFIVANFLLIIGGIIYSLERYNLVISNPLTQYGVQSAVVFQSIFFSIGLADRIKLITQQIIAVENENNQLENLRQAEKKLFVEEKNKVLEKSNKELDIFIYKTAHDIRGPIARLLGLSQLGLLDIKDEKAINYFSLLKSNAEYLNYLLNQTINCS